MKRVIYASLIAMSCSIAVAAQGGMAAPKDKPMEKGAAKTEKAADKSVSVTGCVAESGGHYMLNNAMMADKPGAPMTVALTGGTLKPHVGHKVEVMGMMKPMAKEGAMAGHDMKKEGGMAKEGAAKPAAATDGTLAVKEVKMVAATCS